MGVIKKILFRWKKAIDLGSVLSLTTTSNSATWSPSAVINTGSALTWEATGGVTQTIVADDPIFNLSTNVGTVNMSVYDISLLSQIYFPGLNLTSIDLSEASALLNINLNGNTSLTTLDITSNTALTDLWFGQTGLTSIDLSNNTALTFLYFNLSIMTSIDITNQTSLDYLTCQGTPLTTLNLSANTVLTHLDCATCNSFTTLDISNNTLLTFVRIDQNNFSSTVTNSILASLVSHGLSNGDLTYRNNETGQGITDRATLISRGWSIANSPT